MVAVSGFIMMITSVPIFQASALWAVALESHFGWSRTQLGLALSFTRIEGSLTGPIAGYMVDRLGRGMAMGLAMVGMGVGGLVLMPLIAWLINPDADRIGWRHTAEIFAVITLISALVLPKIIRNKPEDIADYPDGQAPVVADSDSQASEVEQNQELGLLMSDLDYGLQTAAWIIMLQTSVSIVFQFLGGWIGDLIPKNVALFIFTTIQGIGVVFLVIGPELIYFYAFAVLFGIGFGGRTPLTTAIRGDYFGRASFGKILGISTVPMNVLLLVAAPMAGFMRDELGDYDLAFITLAGLNMVGAILFLVARKPKLTGNL